jgi:PAS domain S-box-containing protein
MDLFADFLGRQGFLPHGYCFTWTPALLWSMVTADAVIALSYFSIPAVIVAFLSRRPDVRYRWVAVLFSVFIFACGITHVMDIWTVWVPDYGLHAVTKVFTAVVSLATAAGLWPLLPKILKIPSVEQLQQAIAQLESEVAKRKTAEEHLADTERSLASALGIIGAGFVTADANGRVLRMNDVAERLTGWKSAAAAGLPIGDVLRASPGSLVDVAALTRVNALEAAGRRATVSLPLARQGGGESLVELTAGLDHDELDQVRGVTLLMRDETELKTAEREVDRLAAIVESTSDAIISCNPQGQITSWNNGAQELFGYRADEAIGADIAMLVPADLHAEAEAVASEVSGGRRIPHFDTQRQRRNGERVDVAVTFSPVRDADGDVVGYSMIASDVTDRRRAQAALRESQTRLSHAMDAAQLGTWEMDTTTGTFERSRRHDECYGYASPQPIWTIDSYYRAIHPDDREEIFADWNRTVLEQKRQWAREMRIIWPDGSEHWVSVCAGVHEEAGKPMRVLGVIGDITQRKQAEQAMLRAGQLEAENRRVIEDRYIAERERRRAAEALAESQRDANRAKTEFLATINHELRTPLNAILGMAELARSPDVDEPVRRGYIKQIANSGKEMAELMSQVLDMTRIEAGRLELDNVIFDLPTLLGGMRDTYAPLAAARGLTFHFEVDAGLPRTVFGDPLRLRQIINNLMSNALKFTLKGSVTLATRPIAVNRYRFEVRDTGIGIAADATERLFQPYSQATASTTREFGGTGLGLYICKQLAQLMGGDVGVLSVPGEGSTFWADIEMGGVTTRSTPAIGPQERALPDISGLRVLVVDDNLINREVVSVMLQRAHVMVKQACNGQEAVDAVVEGGDKSLYDVILMDMRMPVMGGIEAMSLIRGLQKGADLPIIAFTADTMGEDRDRVFEAGADALLAKPIDKQQLFEALWNVTRGRDGDGLGDGASSS